MGNIILFKRYYPPAPPLKNPCGPNIPRGCEIPDYRKVTLDEAPELLETQKRLAARGLKSNWLRNDAWRYNRKIWGSPKQKILWFFGTGFRTGMVLLTIHLVAENTVFKKEGDGHGHGHGEH